MWPSPCMASRALTARLSSADFELVGVGFNGGQVLGERGLHLDGGTKRALQQFLHAGDQFHRADAIVFQFLPTGEGQHATGQRTAAHGALDGIVEQLELRRIGRHALAQEFETAEHSHQQIVEIVGDAAGQIADGFHLLGLTQAFPGFGQRGGALLEPLLEQAFGVLLVIDVGVAADPARDGAVVIADRHGAGEMPAPGAVMAADAKLCLIGRAGLDRGLPGQRRLPHVLGMDDAAPQCPVQFTRTSAAIGIDLIVEPIELPVRRRGPDVVWHGLRKGAELRFTLTQRELGAPALDGRPRPVGDFANEREFLVGPHTRGGVVEIEQRNEPALLGHRHVDERAGADVLERRGGALGTWIEPGVGDEDGLAALQILDIGAVLAEVQDAGEAMGAGGVPVALDGDGFGGLVDGAIAGPADVEFGAEKLRRRKGDVVGVLDLADGLGRAWRGPVRGSGHVRGGPPPDGARARRRRGQRSPPRRR